MVNYKSTKKTIKRNFFNQIGNKSAHTHTHDHTTQLTPFKMDGILLGLVQNVQADDISIVIQKKNKINCINR